MDNAQKIYTSKELAQILRITEETIWKKCRLREWPHLRIGRYYRFTESDLQAILEILRPATVRPVRRGKRMPL